MSSIESMALARYGHQAQMLQAIGEMAELTDKLIKRINQGRCNDDDISEEIADVEIMMKQLREIFGEERVSEWKLRKLERQAQRLAK